jgi:hypothetical protein
MKFCEVFGEDISSISKSYSEAFPEVEPDSVFNILMWKFFSQKNWGHYWVLSEESNQDIVAGYGIIDMPIASEYKYGLVADVYTTPKYQNKGMFTKLGNSVKGPISELKYNFSIGFPVRKNVIPGHLKAGWKVAFSMPVVGTLSIFKAACSFLYGRSLWTNIEHRKFLEVSHEVLDFLNDLRLGTPNQILIAKRYTREYLEWRLSRPKVDYFETILRDADGIVAWILSRKTKIRGIPIWVIMDIQVTLPAPTSYKGLLNYLGRVAIVNNCWILAGCWNPTYSKDLRVCLKSGFIKLGQQDVIYRAYQEELNFPEEVLSRLSWIDSDTL